MTWTQVIALLIASSGWTTAPKGGDQSGSERLATIETIGEGAVLVVIATTSAGATSAGATRAAVRIALPAEGVVPCGDPAAAAAAAGAAAAEGGTAAAVAAAEEAAAVRAGGLGRLGHQAWGLRCHRSRGRPQGCRRHQGGEAGPGAAHLRQAFGSSRRRRLVRRTAGMPAAHQACFLCLVRRRRSQARYGMTPRRRPELGCHPLSAAAAAAAAAMPRARHRRCHRHVQCLGLQQLERGVARWWR